VGQRAVKPLLDALAGSDEGQQRVAIDVLAYVQNKNAAPALFSFATGSADTPLRVRAMIACGALEAAELLPRYESYLFPKSAEGDDAPPADAVAVAASWSVARMADRRAVPLLRELAKRGNAEMRALGVLGLGILRDRASIVEIARIAKSTDSGNVTRAAAAYALGELGADSEVATLVTLAEGTDALPREMALVALARLGSASGAPNRAAVAAMADAVFAGGDSETSHGRSNARGVRLAGGRALMLLAASKAEAARVTRSPLLVPDGPLDVEAELEQLVPDGFSAEGRAMALVTFAESIRRAAVSAIETSSGGALAVLDALGDGNKTLLPFVGAGETGDTSDAGDRARAEAERITVALEPGLVNRSQDPDPAMRTRAILLLGRSASDGATAAVVVGTRDANEAVERAALSALGKRASPAALQAVTGALQRHDHFALRVLAAQALGRLGSNGGSEDAARSLREAATHDEFALVREAALGALAKFDAPGARQLAVELVGADPEPRVRDLARAVLEGAKP
jgi:HEAT repeat protein